MDLEFGWLWIFSIILNEKISFFILDVPAHNHKVLT